MSLHQSRTASSNGAASASPLDEDTIRQALAAFTESDQALLSSAMDNPRADESLLGGLERFLDQASKARFLNTLKLEKCGHWIGATAPDRLQIRLNEIARQSQHPAFAAFRAGLGKSGGLERAYPKAKI